ncbi:hypothetical protein D3C76_1347080 [compost metagenome]
MDVFDEGKLNFKKALMLVASYLVAAIQHADIAVGAEGLLPRCAQHHCKYVRVIFPGMQLLQE